MSSSARSQTVVVADDWMGLLTAYCLHQSGHDFTLQWVPRANPPSNMLLLESIAPWKEGSMPDAKTVQSFDFLMSQLDGVAVERKGLLSLDIDNAAELETAEQWVMSEVTQETDLQVLDEKVWVNIEPRLMSDAKLAIWRPDVMEISRSVFEQSLLDLLSQQGIKVCLLEGVPSVAANGQRVNALTSSFGNEWSVDELVITSTHLAQNVLLEPDSFPYSESLMSFFKVHPGFLKHLVQVSGLLLMPQEDGKLYVRSQHFSGAMIELIEAETQLWEALQDVYPETAMFEPLESARFLESEFVGSSTVFENVSIVLSKESKGLLQAFHQAMQFSKQFNS